MAIFRIKSVKIYTGQKIYTGISVGSVTNMRYVLESNAQRFSFSKTLHSTITRCQRANWELLCVDYTLLESDTPRFCQLYFYQKPYTTRRCQRAN